MTISTQGIAPRSQGIVLTLPEIFPVPEIFPEIFIKLVRELNNSEYKNVVEIAIINALKSPKWTPDKLGLITQSEELTAVDKERLWGVLVQAIKEGEQDPIFLQNAHTIFLQTQTHEQSLDMFFAELTNPKPETRTAPSPTDWMRSFGPGIRKISP